MIVKVKAGVFNLTFSEIAGSLIYLTFMAISPKKLYIFVKVLQSDCLALLMLISWAW